ncbi:MAG TPA: RpiB/LacA/LacB family sugar-phosphate isomerase [Candidatus Nanoarchaeia archaeon]|nr:RpiB/LacA/LacB family sugar-phosphate isomerase [Candidatus Nanoarchaeia archaeon]
MTKKIYLGADHAGFKLKEKIKSWLKVKNIPFEDLGNLIYDKNDDYPDFAEKVGQRVVKDKIKGILLCGSAEGICIAANKIRGVRAVNPQDILQTKLSRADNDANILCLAGGGMLKPIPGIPLEKAKKIIMVFLKTAFSGEKRHLRRLNKIKRLESLKH